MPRLPAGFHRDAGAGVRGHIRPQRYDATRQHNYWRHTVTELHAGASVTQFVLFGNPATPVSATIGPQGTGERWLVDMVAVQTGAQYGQPPLVVQQIAGQAAGVTVTPPPPVTAQAWLSVAGQNVHLLAQTASGGNDNLSVACPPIGAGEAITVVWYGLTGPFTGPASAVPAAWFRLRGTRYALSVT